MKVLEDEYGFTEHDETPDGGGDARQRGWGRYELLMQLRDAAPQPPTPDLEWERNIHEQLDTLNAPRADSRGYPFSINGRFAHLRIRSAGASVLSEEAPDSRNLAAILHDLFDSRPIATPTGRVAFFSMEAKLAYAAKYLNEWRMASSRPTEQWISVEERLPHKNVMVLVHCPDWPAGYPRVMTAHVDGLGEWCGHYADDTHCGWGTTIATSLPTGDPTFWRPLPLPPSGAERFGPCEITPNCTLGFHHEGACNAGAEKREE